MCVVIIVVIIVVLVDTCCCCDLIIHGDLLSLRNDMVVCRLMLAEWSSEV